MIEELLENMTKRLQMGNRKLPSTTGIWNLPSGKTCPKSTEECRKWCYAKKAERMYPNVLPFRKMNLLLTTEPILFIEIICQEIFDRDIKVVRIHESGDFYNQTYLENWFSISIMFPDVVFYAYTKSYHLDFTLRPKNFIVLLSDDNKLLKKHWNLFDGITIVMEDIKKIPKGWILCPNDCKLCDCCYNLYRKEKKMVIFKKH